MVQNSFSFAEALFLKSAKMRVTGADRQARDIRVSKFAQYCREEGQYCPIDEQFDAGRKVCDAHEENKTTYRR